MGTGGARDRGARGGTSALGLVVSNSSPLIGLNQVHALGLLEQLYGTVTIPLAVAREVQVSVEIPRWVVVRPLAVPLPDRIQRATLDLGEKEVLGLALEASNALVIMDDLPARRVAGSLGLMLVGTVGVLLEAKRAGFLDRVRPLLDALVTARFFVSASLYRDILTRASER